MLFRSYTPRVRRMLITTGILYLLILAFVLLPGIWMMAAGGTVLTLPGVMAEPAYPVFRNVEFILLLMFILQPFLVLLANRINHPIEQGINRRYIDDAARILREMPELKVIGVTGSYGKTSVKYFLHTLLSAQYNVLCTPGNFNTTLGVVRTIREHMKPFHEIFICEVFR